MSATDEKRKGTATGRDGKGRFTSGNQAAKGRATGISCRTLKLAREAAEFVAIPVLVELAKKGDIKACEILMSAGVPKSKPVEVPEPLNLPEAADRQTFLGGLLDGVRSGQISLDQATRAMALWDGMPESDALIDPLSVQLAFVRSDGNGGMDSDDD